jgi:hypothetical protein
MSSDILQSSYNATPHSHGPTPPRVYSLQPSPRDEEVTAIYAQGYHPDTPPLYSVLSSQYRNPNVSVYRGGPISQSSVAIGTAKLSMLSSGIELSLNGQRMHMKKSQMVESFSVENSVIGKLKWKPNEWIDGLWELFHNSGFKMAQLKIGGPFRSGEQKLEILCACDHFIADLIVLSGMVAKAQAETTEEVAVEVFKGLAGI